MLKLNEKATITLTRTSMKIFCTLLATALLAAAPVVAQATPLNLIDFEGTESIMTFDDGPSGPITGPLTYQGVTFTAESGHLLRQLYGGSVIGTTGIALNTINGPGNADMTLNFATGISRFGMNFGTCDTCHLSATITAYDASNLIVESMNLPSVTNSFVGFDFSSSVSKIFIDRTDADAIGYFTFIDDVRFKEGGQVPEPASLALLSIGALVIALARRRHKN